MAWCGIAHAKTSRFLAVLVLTGFLAACVSSGNSAGPPPEPPPPQAQPTTPVESEPLEGAGPLLGTTQSQGVRVALLVPQSGNGATVGQSIRKAAEMAAFDLQNRSLILQPYDTRGTPAGAAEAARMAIAQGAQIIVGPLFGDSVRAVSGIAAQAGINVLAFSTDEAAGGGSVYLMGFLMSDQIQRVLSHARRMGRSSAAILAPANGFGYAVAAAVRQVAPQLGLSLTAEEYYDPNLPDSSAVIQQVQARPFDILVLADQGLSLRALATQLPFYGITASDVTIVGPMVWGADRALATEQALHGAFFPAVSPETKANFDARYRSNFGELPVDIAGLGYDAVALASVLSSQGGIQTGNAAARLQSPIGFQGVYGIFRFAADGSADRGLAIMQVGPGGAQVADPAPTSFAPRPGS